MSHRIDLPPRERTVYHDGMTQAAREKAERFVKEMGVPTMAEIRDKLTKGLLRAGLDPSEFLVDAPTDLEEVKRTFWGAAFSEGFDADLERDRTWTNYHKTPQPLENEMEEPVGDAGQRQTIGEDTTVPGTGTMPQIRDMIIALRDDACAIERRLAEICEAVYGSQAQGEEAGSVTAEPNGQLEVIVARSVEATAALDRVAKLVSTLEKLV